jgi:hypothetical protein
MDIFMTEFSQAYKNYRIIMVMDRASWHTGDKAKKWENTVPPDFVTFYDFDMVQEFAI